jgi:flagellar assembly protein FliH
VAHGGFIRILRGDAGQRAEAASFRTDVASVPVGGLLGAGGELAAAREEAYQAGYQAALAEQSAALEADRTLLLGRVAEALTAVVGEVRSRRTADMADVESGVVDLAFELAEALVQHELAHCGDATREAVKRAISLVPSGEDIIVRLAPGDAVSPESLEALVPEGNVKVVSDEAVEHGGCIVEAGPCRVDGQITSALERVRALLQGEAGQ